ncbi:MAG: hypothetical protein DRQ44_09430 [Gammaproteobacteria bacterium]|nr:MAG: hypothetical protein DRQ44_09430 [Gammaproteobacteria bacterium]
MSEVKSPIDRFNQRVRNNPVLATLIIVGSLIIALSTFTDAAKNLLSLIALDTRPDINRSWKAEVTYDWQNAKYMETFTFRGDGEELYGTASFLGKKRGILEGVIKKDKLLFITKTQEVLGDKEPRTSIHRYRGKYSEDRIEFIMQTENGYSEHEPVEFTAKKIVNE